MTHINLAAPPTATGFNPVSSSILRASKDGCLNIVNVLTGSHYTMTHAGILTTTCSGPIACDTVTITCSKIESALRSTCSGTCAVKTSSFTSFMYFFPKVKIIGHLEVQCACVGGGPVPVQSAQYKFEDLSTTDSVQFTLAGGCGNAVFKMEETVACVTSTIVTYCLPACEKEVVFDFTFKCEGQDKLSRMLKCDAGKTQISTTSLTADIAEVKVSFNATTDQTSVKTLKSDYILLVYPSMFAGYDVCLTERLEGEVKIWDTNNTCTEACWTRIRSGDAPRKGEMVVENGLIRTRISEGSAPRLQIFGWDNQVCGNWISTHDVMPINSGGSVSNVVQDIVITKLNPAQVKLNVRFGIVDYALKMARGNPFITLMSNSTQFKVETSKERFALSTGTPATQIQNYNQLKSDDACRGNPLNLCPPVTTTTFTDDCNVNTGLNLRDDNWYAFYNITCCETAGWVADLLEPTGLTVAATTACALDEIIWTYPRKTVMGTGVINADTVTQVNCIPLIFHVGTPDTYVKWRANESIWTFSERQFLRKRR